MFSFFLPPRYVAEYKSRPDPFKNGLAEFVFQRTYSRGGETWADVCARVINGMYSIQKDYALDVGAPWSDDKAMRSAKQAFDGLFNLYWSPPGRGLWMMGTPFIHERGAVEALNNCAFISSAYIERERGSFFKWLMEMLMLGVGVGFDTKGENNLDVGRPNDEVTKVVTIKDSREGWAHSLELLVDSYLNSSARLEFDYSDVRPFGTPIVGFGGVASGPKPLYQLHDGVRQALDQAVGKRLTSTTIVDICNMVGRCVVAGNVRRSAEIALGDASDVNFLNLKNYTTNPHRADYGWVSNNSVVVDGVTDYLPYAERTWENGEPGYVWMDNVRRYGRMNGVEDGTDFGAAGFNPCAEQPLWHREMCTLAEVYLPNILTTTQYDAAIKAAFLYAKSVTLLSNRISDPQSREVMMANGRIGLSATGQMQYAGQYGMNALAKRLEYGYALTEHFDNKYSEWFGVNPAIRRTTVKPSGTVSLVAGVTPGVHFPISRFYIRRVSISAESALAEKMRSLGYNVEPSAVDPHGTVIVEFPVDAGYGVRGESEVTVREQLEVARLNQRVWSDNGVSITVKFDRATTSPKQLSQYLQEYSGALKAVSFLPSDHDYEQAPYETITEAQYRKMAAAVTQGIGEVGAGEQALDLYCDGEACELPDVS